MGTDREKFVEGLKFNPNKGTIKNSPADLNDRKFKRKSSEKIRDLANRVKINAVKYGAAALIGVTMLAGMTGCGTRIPEQPEITQSETGNREENKELKEIENIDSIDELKTDFIKRYVEAYNEAYGTEYSTNEVDLLNSTVAIFEVNGKRVASSRNGVAIRAELEKLGEVNVSTDQQIIQLVTEDGVILGSYDSLGRFIYSGSYQLDSVSDDTFDAPTSERLGMSSDVIKTAGEVTHADGVESKDSIKIRISRYKASVKKAIEKLLNINRDGAER